MATTRKKKSNQQIIVLDRGWVYVGHTRRDGDGSGYGYGSGYGW